MPRLEAGEALAAARRDHDVHPIVIHAIYLINLASADPVLAQRSRSSLIATLVAGKFLGVDGVVTHLGSHGGRGFDAVAQQVSDGLVEILEAVPDGPDLIVENSAGAGGTIGSEMEELGALLDLAGRHPRLKIALDTAHLCASGWDFRDPAVVGRLLDRVDSCLTRERVVLIHANDSLLAVGSKRDRHANIGEGAIGIEGFRHLAQSDLHHVPWILETPDLGTPSESDSPYRSLHVLSELCRELLSADSDEVT